MYDLNILLKRQIVKMGKSKTELNVIYKNSLKYKKQMFQEDGERYTIQMLTKRKVEQLISGKEESGTRDMTQ